MFRRNHRVEVMKTQPEFKGAYLFAVIKREPNWAGVCTVEYRPRDVDRSEYVREKVHVSVIRPLPPRPSYAEYQVGDLVEELRPDGFWRGVILERELSAPHPRYDVWFENVPELKSCQHYVLRFACDWERINNEEGRWSFAKRYPVISDEIETEDDDSSGGDDDDDDDDGNDEVGDPADFGDEGSGSDGGEGGSGGGEERSSKRRRMCGSFGRVSAEKC